MTAPQPLTGLVALPVADIHPSPNNPRTHLDDIEDLAQSIREQGLIQPLIVQRIPGEAGFRIVAGHRRFAAVQALKWDKVPAIVRRDLLPDEELLAMLVENGQRSSLDPVEEARALARLMKTGQSQADVARQVGRPVSWVRDRVLLLQLPAEEQDAVRAGHYTLTHAYGLIRRAREEERRRARPTGGTVGRPKGAKTKPYFGDSHPLAEAARARCSCRGTPKVAGVACGPCWEAVIRLDQSALDAPGSAA